MGIKKSYEFVVSGTPPDLRDWLKERARRQGDRIDGETESGFDVHIARSIAKNRWAADLEFDVQETDGGASKVFVTVDMAGSKHVQVLREFLEPLGDRAGEPVLSTGTSSDAEGPASDEPAVLAPEAGKAPGRRGGVALDALPKRVVKTAAMHMAADEKIDFALVGNSSQTLVALSDRILILKPGFMANTAFGCRATTLYYRDITGVQINTGLVTAVLEVSSPSYQARPVDYWQSAGKARDARAESAHVAPNCIPASKKLVEEWQPYLALIRERLSAAKQDRVQAQPTAPPADNPLDQLRLLADLRASGAITDDEFEQKKAELLSRI